MATASTASPDFHPHVAFERQAASIIRVSDDLEGDRSDVHHNVTTPESV